MVWLLSVMTRWTSLMVMPMPYILLAAVVATGTTGRLDVHAPCLTMRIEDATETQLKQDVVPAYDRRPAELCLVAAMAFMSEFLLFSYNSPPPAQV
jgi:hypothetical protein